MKALFRVAAALLAISFLPALFGQATAQQATICDGCTLIEEAMKAAQSLTPGTPRSKVEIDFRSDGGLQPLPGPTRYVFKKCSAIKIEIEFTHFDGQQDGLSSDQVIKVSRPYLESPFSD